jgi:hypothetical protein
MKNEAKKAKDCEAHSTELPLNKFPIRIKADMQSNVPWASSVFTDQDGSARKLEIDRTW